jgi:hypothetical protein
MAKRSIPRTRNAEDRASVRSVLTADAIEALTSHDPSGNKDRAELAEWLAQIAAIQAHIVPLAIATSVADGDFWGFSVASFLELTGAYDKMQAFGDELQKLKIGDDIRTPDDDGIPGIGSYLVDAANVLANDFTKAGYMLGLAVGMRLGPDALTGGAR